MRVRILILLVIKMVNKSEKIVVVINMRGEQIANTTPSKARKLLKDKKAKVIGQNPFTIQMLIATGENGKKLSCTIKCEG